MKYSKSEYLAFIDGINTAKEDWSYCKGNKKEINECIKVRYRFKDLC